VRVPASFWSPSRGATSTTVTWSLADMPGT
jgi:hypothetical protein